MDTVYHIDTGPTQMYDVDAKNAVNAHPDEWSKDPWPVEQQNAWRRQKHDAAVAEARAAGRPEPPPPPALELTEEDRAALGEDEARRQEAREIVAKDDAMAKEKRDWEEKVKQARAYLAQPAPQPGAFAEEQAAREANIRPSPDFNLPEDWRDRMMAGRRGFAIRLGAPRTIKNADVDQFIAEAEAKRKSADAPLDEQKQAVAEASATANAVRSSRPNKSGPE